MAGSRSPILEEHRREREEYEDEPETSHQRLVNAATRFAQDMDEKNPELLEEIRGMSGDAKTGEDPSWLRKDNIDAALDMYNSHRQSMEHTDLRPGEDKQLSHALAQRLAEPAQEQIKALRDNVELPHVNEPEVHDRVMKLLQKDLEGRAKSTELAIAGGLENGDQAQYLNGLNGMREIGKDIKRIESRGLDSEADFEDRTTRQQYNMLMAEAEFHRDLGEKYPGLSNEMEQAHEFRPPRGTGGGQTLWDRTTHFRNGGEPSWMKENRQETTDGMYTSFQAAVGSKFLGHDPNDEYADNHDYERKFDIAEDFGRTLSAPVSAQLEGLKNHPEFLQMNPEERKEFKLGMEHEAEQARILIGVGLAHDDRETFNHALENLRLIQQELNLMETQGINGTRQEARQVSHGQTHQEDYNQERRTGADPESMSLVNHQPDNARDIILQESAINHLIGEGRSRAEVGPEERRYLYALTHALAEKNPEILGDLAQGDYHDAKNAQEGDADLTYALNEASGELSPDRRERLEGRVKDILAGNAQEEASDLQEKTAGTEANHPVAGTPPEEERTSWRKFFSNLFSSRKQDEGPNGPN